MQKYYEWVAMPKPKPKPKSVPKSECEPKFGLNLAPRLVGFIYLLLIIYAPINFFGTSELMEKSLPLELYNLYQTRLFSGHVLIFAFWPVSVYSQYFTDNANEY